MVLSHQYLFPAIHALRHLYHFRKNIQLHSLVLFHILFGSRPSDVRAFPLVEVCGWRILSFFLSWKVCRFEPPGIFLTDGIFPSLVQKDHSAQKADFPGLKGQTSRRETKHVSWGLLCVLWASLVAQLVKNLSAHNGRQETRWKFNPWVGKIPWRRKWQPTAGFSPGESHEQRSLAGHSPWGRRESDTTKRLNTYVLWVWITAETHLEGEHNQDILVIRGRERKNSKRESEVDTRQIERQRGERERYDQGISGSQITLPC